MSKDEMHRNNNTSFQPFSPSLNPQSKSFFSSSIFSPRQDQHNKISQLHNKVTFFQGQLDELSAQNKILKSKVIQAQRQIQSSTQLLRNLLPEPSQVEKQIQLKLANLERVSEMIKQDWDHMQKKVKKYKQQVENKKKELERAESDLKKAAQENEEKVQDLKEKHSQNLKRTKQEWQKKVEGLRFRIEQLQEERNIQQSQKKNREMQLKRYRAESQEKNAQNSRLIIGLEKLNEKLTLDIATMVKQQEENTKIIINHFHQISLDKQKQLKQNYQYVLKTRQQEYASALKQLIDLRNISDAKITQKEEQILQLLQVNGRYIKQKNEITGECERYKQSLTMEQNRVIKLNEQLQLQNIALLQNEKQISELREHKRIQAQELTNKNIQLMKKNSGLQIRMNKMKAKLEKELGQQIEKYKEKREENEKLSMHVLERQAQIRKLGKQIRQKNKEVEKLKQMEKENKQLKESLKTERQKSQIAQKQLLQYQNIVLQKEKELQQHQKKYEASVQRLRNEYDLQMERIQKESFQSYGEKERKFKQYIDTVSQRHALELREKDEAAAEKQEELIEKLKDQLKNIKELEQTKTKREMQISELQEAHAQWIAKARKEYEEEMERERQKSIKTIEQSQLNYTKKIYQNTKYYQEQMKEQERKNLQQIQLREKQFEELIKLKQIELQNKLKTLQEDMQKLKANNGLEALQTHYSVIIAKLKEENSKEKEQSQKKQQQALANMRQNYKLRCASRQQEHMNQMNILRLEHSDRLRELKEDFKEELEKISFFLQQNIFSLNWQLKNQKQSHHFTKLSTQQKFAYLSQKICSMKNRIEKSDQNVLQLTAQIEQKNKQLENVDRLINERMNKKKQEYELYISQLTANCEGKIAQTISDCNEIVRKAEKEKIKFTQSLSKDFEEIKNICNSRVLGLQRQYQQLQKLFQERPSREEDMNKIKQLTLIKQKMDIEVNEYKKKISDANEIVKYMNLQLENYKQVYDIFGPEGVTQNILTLKKRDDFTSSTKNEENEDQVEKIRKLSLKEMYRSKQSEKQKNNSSLPQVLKKRSIRIKSEMSTSQALKRRSEQDGEEETYFQNEQKKIATIQQDLQGQREQILENGEVVKHHRTATNPNTKYKYKKLQKSRSYINTDIQNGQKSSQNLVNQLKSKSALKHSYIKNYTKINQESEASGNTQDIRTNADMFLELLNTPLKAPPIEKKSRNNGYGKMSLNKRHSNLEKPEKEMRQIGVQRIKKYQIMNRIVGLKN